MSRKTIFIAISLLMVAGIVLAGCAQPTPEIIQVEKTVVQTQEVLVEGETVVQEVVVTATPEPVEEAPPEERTLVICLGQEPQSLYPYADSSGLISSQVLQSIYDGPFDNRSYGHQAVILEKLPSIADGDAVVEAVAVADGDSVVGDDGEIYDLEAGVVVHPAGCRSSDCAVTYEGGGMEMDRIVVTFKLLPGLLWSDGAPLTTSDSVYSFNLAGDPGTRPAWKYTYDRTASYEAPDDVTTVWTGLPGYIDSNYFTNFWTPLPEHVWGQYTAAELTEAVDANALYLGWGPYIIDEWVRGDRITLHKNPNYWRADEGLPKFDFLVYRIVGGNTNANIAAILSGECDIVDQTAGLDDQSDVLLELQAAGQVNATFVTGTVWEHASFNIHPAEGSGFAGWDEDGDNQGPFGDIRLRRAVAMCMDRQAVVDTVMFGQSIVLDVYVPPEHPLFNADVTHYPFDVEAASALLDEVGWIDDDGDPATPRIAEGVTGVPDGTPLEFAYETTSATQRQQVTQILAESMAQCGMKVNLNYYPAGEWFANGPDGKLFGRRFDLGQFAWVMQVEPPCGLYLSSQIPGQVEESNPFNDLPYADWNAFNVTGFHDPEFDLVCNTAVQSLPGEDAYVENHLEAQEIFASELPSVPLYLRLKLAITRPDMCGFIMDPTNLSEMWNIEEFDYGPPCGQ